MHKKRPTLPEGLIWRGNTIHIRASVNNEDIWASTKTDQVKKAVVILEHRKVAVRLLQEEMKHMKLHNIAVPSGMLGKTYGDAVKLFKSKGTRKGKNGKQVIESAIKQMSWCLPLDTPLNNIHQSTIEPFVEHMKANGNKATAINHYTKIVQKIVNVAMKKEENGVPWRNRQLYLEHQPTKNNADSKMNARKGYVLSWEEQDRLLDALPEHLYFPALYSLNTGARMSEMTELRWSWEIKFPTLNISAFRIPAEFHKNGKPKLVVLNSIASKIVEQNRGRHPEHVFTYLDRNTHKLRPIKRLGGTAFQRIRKTVGLGHVVFHDFRTTFSTRLGGYDVSKDTISILMGHTIAGVTADYAFRTTIVESLVAAVDNLVERKTFTFVQANENLGHTKVTQTFNFISDAKNEASKSLKKLVKNGRDERIRTSDHSTPS